MLKWRIRGELNQEKGMWLFYYIFYNRDAEDAVKGLDGTRIAGTRVRVEMSNGKTRDRGGRGGRGGGSRRDYSRSRSRSGGRRERRRSPSYRSMSRGRGRSRSRS